MIRAGAAAALLAAMARARAQELAALRGGEVTALASATALLVAG